MKITLYILIAVLTAQLSYSQAEPLCAFKVDNIWFFLDESGKELFPAKILDGVGSYSEGKFFAKISTKDTSYFCYFDNKGNELFKVNSSLPFNFNYGRALTVRFLNEKADKRLYGFVDDQGNVLFDNVLFDALDFTDSLAYIDNPEHKGYIGVDGKFKLIIDDIHIGYRFSEGIAAISNADLQFAFIDTSGEIVIPFKYDEVGEFNEGLCRVYYHGHFGFINRNGDLVIGHNFEEARDFKESHAFVGKYDHTQMFKWGFINIDGRLIEDYIYDVARNFSEGLAAVNKGGKWGYIDYDGKTVIDFKFDNADSFSGGLAFAVDNDSNKAGYINKAGEFVYTFIKFDVLVDFRNNTRFYSFSSIDNE